MSGLTSSNVGGSIIGGSMIGGGSIIKQEIKNINKNLENAEIEELSEISSAMKPERDI